MTSASVGFQCPECVAEGAAATPVIRARFGGVAISRPYVTLTLVGINVLVFGWENLVGVNEAAGTWGMWPVGVALNNEYYRLFTATFLHENFLHIGFNMLVLWMLGPQLEALLGHVRFSVLYVVAGLGGSVASFWFSAPNVVGIGASGAIFGLMGAYVVVGRALRADISQVLGLIAINVVIGFVGGGIDWRAHLGGLVTGALVAAIFAYAPKQQRVLWQVVGVVLVVAGLTVLVTTRDAALTSLLALGGLDSSA